MCKTIKQKIKFSASPLAVYQVLTDAKKIQLFSGKKAKNDNQVGGFFSNYGGDASGVIVDLLEAKRVVQAWRHRNFPEGIYSMATYSLLRTKDGKTELTLTHRGVPKDLIPQIELEWRTLYWNKMKEFLSRLKNRDGI